MNIVTVCSPNNWVNTHLVRFMWFARTAMYSAAMRYYLIIPYTAETERAANEVALRLQPYFDGIKLTEQQPMVGRLLYFDWLRSYALDAFNLAEALYADCDMDIMEDISDIPQQSSADLLWTPDAIKGDGVEQALAAYELDTDSNVRSMNPGLMYMRHSFVDMFEEILDAGKVRRDTFVPGSGIWSVIQRLHPSSFMLPKAYNQAPWSYKDLVGAKVIHYVGDRFKPQRFRYGFSGWPDKLEIDILTPQQYYKWDQVPCVENDS